MWNRGEIFMRGKQIAVFERKRTVREGSKLFQVLTEKIEGGPVILVTSEEMGREVNCFLLE